MIVQCPSCDTKYNFPDESYKEGRKVKCTICEHVFPLPPVPAAPEPEPDEDDDDLFSEAASDGDIDSLFDDEEPAPRAAAAPPAEDDDMFFEEGEVEPEEAPAAARSRSSVEDEFSLDDDLEGSDRLNLDAMTAKDDPKRSKLTMIMGLVALLVLGGLAYYFLPQFMGREEPEQVAAPEGTEEVITTEQIKNFSLEDVKQYYVDNEKVGKLFVVQGKVVNNFSSAKELIQIEANLFDANGVSVVNKTLLIGNTVSLFQLQMLSKDELESAINNKVGILTANTNVPPGGEVPFVIVFYNPPDTVQEFGIKVVAAKDPPKS